jgi:amino acid adenylation domain-containing protein
MTNISTAISDLPPEQQAIRDKCFHPTGKFIEFKKEEVEQSIPERFEQMVDLYPDRLAVKTKNHTFTYNQSANRVAHEILAKRGKRAEPIVLLLENDAPMIAAILGVLKAGKIYVQLDPRFPRARIVSMLRNSQPELIVTNNLNLSLARGVAQNERPLLNIDEPDSSLSAEDLGLPISPDSLAYVRYTSGSTGQPKGVMEKHRNLLHVIMRQTNAFHICAHDRLTFLGSWGRHIFRGLLNGATLYPVDVKEEGLAHIADWLIQEEITIYWSTSTVFRHFVSTLTGQKRFPRLRLVRLSGEPVSRRDVELYKKHFSPDCILVNELVSTEAGHLRHYFIDKNTPIAESIVPVGYAVQDMQILLLDDARKEVRRNDIGEIAVKSLYLSPGYWGWPELTKAAFLPGPEGGDERIYQTGDLGRMMPDGCLLHLGRMDAQIKIRGHRVEVAEIELKLLELDIVKEAVVVAQEDVLRDKRLVAYVVPARHPAPTVSALRCALAEKLPDYMVPSAFVMVDALPLTPTRKLDRRALPAPGSTRPQLDTSFVAPRTPIEGELAKIWAGVLSLDQVGIHDNFFDLGGHSLAAARVISRVINTFKVELPIKSLFESPTVADMAVVITENMAKKAGDEELARMLAELESISDEDARQRLADESK